MIHLDSNQRSKKTRMVIFVTISCKCLCFGIIDCMLSFLFLGTYFSFRCPSKRRKVPDLHVEVVSDRVGGCKYQVLLFFRCHDSKYTLHLRNLETCLQNKANILCWTMLKVTYKIAWATLRSLYEDMNSPLAFPQTVGGFFVNPDSVLSWLQWIK